MYELDDVDREMLEETAEGRKYLEYHKKFKSQPYGFGAGFPDIEGKFSSITALYDECIKQNKTWEELLGWEEPEKNILY